MTRRDDRRLARRAARGDRQAFEAIYRRYHQDLYRFCAAIVANPQDAQEALQSTMVKVLRSLPGEQRRIELKPWLYRIARNEAVETLRKRRDHAELTPERAGASQALADSAEDRERLRRLLADLGGLPSRQRDALLMRELAGLSSEEIAAALETSADTARQTVYEARLGLCQVEAGREMRCDAVMRLLSAGDGRVTRRRDLRAHLRGCASCRAFRDEIAQRHADLAAIAPFPAAAAAPMLHGLLGGSAQGAISSGAGAGRAIATPAIVKTAAGVAIVAAIGVSAADREGLIDVTPGGGHSATTQPPSDRLLRDRRAVVIHATGADRPGLSATRKDRSSHREGATADSHSGRSGKTATAGVGASPTETQAIAGGGARSGGHAHRGHAQPSAHPKRPPQPSTHGQEAAAAHKSPQVNPSPGAGPGSDAAGGPPQPPPSQSNPEAGSPSSAGETAPSEPSTLPPQPG